MDFQSPHSFDVFLSYHWRDHVQVESLAHQLRDEGLTVFLDRWYLTPGQSWPKALEATLAQCHAVGVCIGQGEMGPWQQREQYLALERQASVERQGQNFPVIPILLPGSEPPLGFLRQNTWVDFRHRLNDKVLLTTLVKAIHGESPGPDSQATVRETLATICPYRGLQYFREEDAAFFFGRTEAIGQLVGAIEKHRLVAVVGASGSGKSSVVRAGLVPELRKSHECVWEVVTIVPTDRPLHALAAGLMPILEQDMSETDRLIETNKLADALLQKTVKLRDIVEQILLKQPGTERLLLIVDQWEELFTLCHEDRSRWCFIDNVLDATAATRLSVVLTLRGDFFGRAITNYRPLSDRVQGAQVNVGPMNKEELRLAIVEPARQVGLTFESGLVDLILEQAADEPGHLPLLEFVLRQLWDHRRGGELHHEAYREIGQLEGAIARKAESLYQNASEEDQRRMQQIFFRLVRPGEGEADTRRRATLAELGEGLQGLAKTLTDERLLVTSQLTSRPEETIEVSHEALIRHWDRLKDWVDADRQFLAWQQRLGTSIKEWERSNRSADLLLRGLPLTDALAWLKKKPDQFSLTERQFVLASKRRKTRSRGVAIVAGVLITMFISGPLVWLGKEGETLRFAWSSVMARLHLVKVIEPDEMVKIEAGRFVMEGRDGKRREVTITRDYKLSQHEVTFNEYERFVTLTGEGKVDDEGWGGERRPAINVSWEDAVAYAKWLSWATGKSYRLPTEAEWEYAARSGGTDEKWAGTSEESRLRDYAVFASDRTKPVGSKQPNGLGLYDMSGNVWEWVEDCWHESYQGAPQDGSAWREADGGDCGRRVIRGGSWFNYKPVLLRSSLRNWIFTDDRTYGIGFRVAQAGEP